MRLNAKRDLAPPRATFRSWSADVADHVDRAATAVRQHLRQRTTRYRSLLRVEKLASRNAAERRRIRQLERAAVRHGASAGIDASESTGRLRSIRALASQALEFSDVLARSASRMFTYPDEELVAAIASYRRSLRSIAAVRRTLEYLVAESTRDAKPR